MDKAQKTAFTDYKATSSEPFRLIQIWWISDHNMSLETVLLFLGDWGSKDLRNFGNITHIYTVSHQETGFTLDMIFWKDVKASM
jgi:hypothetical protein